MFAWRRQNPGVRAIFFVQIINRAGDFVVPFLTLILTQVQGLTPAVAGLVVTGATALSAVGGLLAGRWGDRWGRRRTLIAFLSVSAALVASAGGAPASLGATIALTASGFFVGAMRPLLSALVADLSPPELRREAFSLSYLGINVGVSVGPLAAGWFFTHALPWLFWLDALSTLTAVLLLARWVPRDRPHPQATDTPRVPVARLVATHPLLGPLWVLSFGYSLVYAQLFFSLSLQMAASFGLQGPTTYGLVWAFNGALVVGLTPLVLRATRGWTNLRSMTWSLALVTGGLALLLAPLNLALVLVSTAIWTLGEVLISVHWGELITSSGPEEHRGRIQALFSFSSTGGHVLAPLVAGALIEALGLPFLWGVTVAIAALLGLGFARLEARQARQAGAEGP